MTYTTNYSIPLPGYGDTADVQVLNDGTVMIDHLTHGNRTMLAVPWDAETDWMKGNFVVKTDSSTLEADYYECKEDHTTGAWDASKWEHRTIGEVLEILAQSAGGATSLDELDDVEITSPSEGQILRRNANGDWVNTDMPDASVTKTAEGNPVEFTDGADAPLVKCVSAITGYQQGSGTPSPDNIRPIVAYTEGEIEVRGKNLFDIDATHTDYAGVTYQYNISGLKPNTSYTLSTNDDIGSASLSNLYINGTSSATNGVFKSRPATINSGTQGTVTIYVRYSGGNLDLYTAVKNGTYYIQLEEGSTDTTYEPYTSTTHTTTYPSAIYRGSEDAVNGTETHDMVAIDLGSLTWTYSTQYERFTTTLTGYKKPSSNTVPFNAICSCYETVGSNYTADSSYDSCIGANSGSDILAVRDTRYTDATAFTSAVTGQTLAYELATPTTSSVTPTNLPIKSLSGYTHIESSTGDMEIEYIAKAFSPITELVDSQISALQKMMELMLTSARETTMTASANYTAGTLIVACGALYKATTAISSGASLVVGTNITPTTIAAELAALA